MLCWILGHRWEINGVHVTMWFDDLNTSVRCGRCSKRFTDYLRRV